jgi:TDG/mug DNA glycosylase family protein
MKLVIVGCNPTESAVRVGHYYAGRGNPFWPLLYESGVLPEPLEYRDDKRVIEFGIGLTDLVKRPTKTREELTRDDFAEGRVLLSRRLEEFLPRVIAFNGRSAYEQFAQRKCKYGVQRETAYDAKIYVFPEITLLSSPRHSDGLTHLRRLAQLVRKTEKERDARGRE